MFKIRLSPFKIGIFLIGLSLVFPVGYVYGHGLGIDTISSINVEGKEISVSVELPLSFENKNENQITIIATDKETKDTAKNITFLIGLFHENNMIFRHYFFTPDGILPIKINHTSENDITIHGEQDSLLGAWYGTETNPLEISGPIFDSGGLYNFEIEVRTIDDPKNIIEGSQTYYADLIVPEITQFLQKDSKDQDAPFKIKSYFDKIEKFEYDPISKQVTFEMPFDWSEKQISHIPVVHEEIHFPKDFAEFLSPSYTGKVNGIDLFKSSVSVDDYTEEDERIVHFVLLQDHLKFLKNQILKDSEQLPDKMVFTLNTNEEIQFPLTAYTRSEDFAVNLSWDPVSIEPEQNTKFIFTIRDGKTGEPLRNSDYTMVILQGGKEIHKVSGRAEVGGDSEDYYFKEGQTGPTIIRFENIRNTGQETEFGMVVAPEFGSVAFLILLISLISVIFITRKNSINFKKF